MLSNKLYIAVTTRLLFPYRFRLIGWIIFVPSALLGLASMYAGFTIGWLELGRSTELFKGLMSSNNLTDEAAGIGVITGLLLIAFSKEKTEDEMSSYLRLEALQWSVYANYLVLVIAMLLVYDLAFFNVMVYNMFTLLLVFIARYRWLVWQNSAAPSA